MQSLNNKFYTDSYKKYGICAKGVHWSSKETQYLRFEIITSMIKNIESSSIIDIGCGFGEYLNFLKKFNLLPDIYLGIDCEEFMIDIAREQFPKNIFLKCNILKTQIPEADYLICSGALNIFTKNEFLKAIENCFKASKRGFIFNFLTEKSLHNMNEEEVYDFCKKLTNKITISDDYLHNDATFLLEI